MKGDAAEAQQLCRESIAVCREQGDDWGLSSILNLFSSFEMANGNATDAQQHLVEEVKVALRGSFHANVLDALVSIANIRAKTDNAKSALEIVHIVLREPATKHPSRARAEQLRAKLEPQLSPREIETARSKSFDQVVNKILG